MFCIAIHSFLVDTKQKFPNIDIMAIADDIHILGSDKVELIEAYKYLKHELYDKATLKVNPQKCQFINLLQHSHPIDDDFIRNTIEKENIKYVINAATVLKAVIGDDTHVDQQLLSNADQLYKQWYTNLDNTALSIQNSMIIN